MSLAVAQSLPHGKSPEAFRTISEVASDLDVPQHVLRFWEGRFSQVRPVKRAGGRRYYRPDDVDLLRGIRTLLYSDGFTIKGVQKVLRDRGVRYVAEIGRGRASLLGRSVPEREIAAEASDDASDLDVRLPDEEIPADDVVAEGPTHARAALATLERAHALEAQIELEEFIAQSGGPDGALSEERRIRLELLLGELLHMKDRLQAVRRDAI